MVLGSLLLHIQWCKNGCISLDGIHVGVGLSLYKCRLLLFFVCFFGGVMEIKVIKLVIVHLKLC